MLGKAKVSAGSQTLIASNARIVGDIHFTGSLQVQGHVQGNIIADGPGDLVVGEGGLVEGEIRAPHVGINGEVRGDVHATERLDLGVKAVVSGNVHYCLVEIVVGARIDGVMRHVPAAPAENT